ncbi:hypothetical protein Hanom_Chr08g00696791 [Helianthus anomalus]
MTDHDYKSHFSLKKREKKNRYKIQSSHRRFLIISRPKTFLSPKSSAPLIRISTTLDWGDLKG